MMQKLNQRGVTLIELIVVISVAGFLAFMAGVGLVIFFAKWNEVNLYSDFQVDAFNTMYKMKHGVIIEDEGESDFMGIATADSIKLINQGGGMGNHLGIKCFQTTGETLHDNDYVEFWWDPWDGSIKTNYQYGQLHPSRPTTLFPVEHEDEITVTNLSFRRSGADKVVRVLLEAQIQVSDERVRTIRFETRIAADIT